MEDLPKGRLAGSIQAVVVGASAGGHEVLSALLTSLPAGFSMPLIIVQHLHPHQDAFFVECLGKNCQLPVKEADEKEPVMPGSVYFAPANYHLLVEADKTFALSIDEKVNFSRPSIDVLFETAAEAYGRELVGIILTGAGRDGAKGLKRIKEKGGVAIVQDPATAQFPAMPLAAIEAVKVDYVLNIVEIGRLLAGIKE